MAVAGSRALARGVVKPMLMVPDTNASANGFCTALGCSDAGARVLQTWRDPERARRHEAGQ